MKRTEKKMKEKRDINKKNKEKTKKKMCALKSGSLTVQRLSLFVITFDSIKEDCKEHFASRMDSDQVIDIPAGQQGPLCYCVIEKIS